MRHFLLPRAVQRSTTFSFFSARYNKFNRNKKKSWIKKSKSHRGWLRILFLFFGTDRPKCLFNVWQSRFVSETSEGSILMSRRKFIFPKDNRIFFSLWLEKRRNHRMESVNLLQLLTRNLALTMKSKTSEVARLKSSFWSWYCNVEWVSWGGKFVEKSSLRNESCESKPPPILIVKISPWLFHVE